nr:MAG: putative coat protein [Tombusviridae sp.]
MFLLPALATAAGLELYSAIKSTQAPDKGVPIHPTLPRAQPGVFHDTVPQKPHVDPFEVVVKPDSTLDNSKALVVFGDTKHPGINQLVPASAGGQQWSSLVSNQDLSVSNLGTPIVSALVTAACATAAATLPFGQETAKQVCYQAVQSLVQRGLPVTYPAVRELLVKSYNKMVKRNPKTKLPSKKQANVLANTLVRAVNRPAQSGTRGMYSTPVSAPVSASRVIGRTGPPRTRSTSRGVIVTHQELIGTLESVANTYYVEGAVINPGKANVFPWLSTIATNYDKYRVLSMRIMLNPHLPTNTAGKMGVAYDPDSTDDLPVNRGEFFAMIRHVEAPVWQAVAMDIPVSGKEKFTNTHTVSDSKLIDEGQLVFFTDLLTGTGAVADIIVEYSVELISPQQSLFSTSWYELTGMTFSTPAVIKSFTNTGGINVADWKFISSAAAVQTFDIHLPAGNYMLTWKAYDANTGTPQMKITNNTLSPIYYSNSGTTSHHYGIAYLKIISSGNIQNDTGERVTIATASVALVNLENCHVMVTRVAPKIYKDQFGATTLAAGATSTP